jgi:hypothetical protein
MSSVGGKSKKHGEHNIKVVVRSRPMSAAEKAAQAAPLVSCDSDAREVCVGMHSASKRPKKTYNFDLVSTHNPMDDKRTDVESACSDELTVSYDLEF